jgi:hypothetical protein
VFASLALSPPCILVCFNCSRFADRVQGAAVGLAKKDIRQLFPPAEVRISRARDRFARRLSKDPW